MSIFATFHHTPRTLNLLAAALTMAATGSAQAAIHCAGAGLTGAGAWTCTEMFLADGSIAGIPIELWGPTAARGFQAGGMGAVLQQVSWSAQGTFVTTGSVTNFGITNSFARMYVTDSLTWTPAAGAPASFDPNPLTSGGTVAVFSGTLGPGGSVNVSKTVTLGPVTGSTADVASWIGTGTFGETLDLTSNVSVLGASENSQTAAQGSITITFSGITPVPEAPTGGLMGAGLLALCGISRRRWAAELARA